METLARKSVLFLWNGPVVSNKMHQAKLATVCLTKEERDLGIKGMRKWNQAAYMGLIFMLARKSNSLWAQWVWNQHI
ncbi:hypothetical protein FRX31_002799 [Thalictrum thalictroides]|uniref:Uncharacterized protein n=1 Tax=Thalictrum thalictroides TaxID=46969 RepID=A0A7J6XCZ4_THATH|nr:hypothetical protein FRX31_002799 [Thalictrum thalictroides]